MSETSSALPDLSTLAAKPPQRPTENLPSRPSTSNYASALAAQSNPSSSDATPAPRHQSRPMQLALNTDSSDNASESEQTSAKSASWRPNLDRQQSWNMQDHKRAMQSPLMSPSVEKKTDYGFSSKDEKLGQEEAKT